jgi:peptidoglycan/xylan/chitin deacetylase (PgdA/CDA1 family)
MILPPVINDTYLFARKYYLDVFGRIATPQYGVHMLNGHYIDVPNEASEDRFYDSLNKLSKEVDFISFAEGSALVKAKKIPKNEKLLCFSFDDGYEECFTKIKPVLDAFNIKVAFFICPNFVEGSPEYIDNFLKNAVFLKTHKRPMPWSQIKQLHKEGHLIGSHTLNHINCRTTSLEVLDIELRESKQRIEAQLQAPCAHFAYPYGKIEHFSEEALVCAEKYYEFIHSQAGHRDYFSFNGRVLNRRHFEGAWATHHITFYLNKTPLEKV